MEGLKPETLAFACTLSMEQGFVFGSPKASLKGRASCSVSWTVKRKIPKPSPIIALTHDPVSRSLHEGADLARKRTRTQPPLEALLGGDLESLVNFRSQLL